MKILIVGAYSIDKTEFVINSYLFLISSHVAGSDPNLCIVLKRARSISWQVLIMRETLNYPTHQASVGCSPPLQWRHNDHDGVLFHQLHGCYSIVYSDGDQRKHQKLRVTGLCAGKSSGTGEFFAQRASNAEMFPFDDVIWAIRGGNRFHSSRCVCTEEYYAVTKGVFNTVTLHEHHGVSNNRECGKHFNVTTSSGE